MLMSFQPAMRISCHRLRPIYFHRDFQDELNCKNVSQRYDPVTHCISSILKKTVICKACELNCKRKRRFHIRIYFSV